MYLNYKNFIQYFEKDKKFDQIESRNISGKFLIEFTFIAVSLILIFSLANLAKQFYEATFINIITILIYILNLFFYKKTSHYNSPCFIMIMTSSILLFFQQIIIPWQAYHSLLFFPAIAILPLATFDKNIYIKLSILFTTIVGIASYYIAKSGKYLVRDLSEADIDFYIVSTLILGLYATYKVVSIIYFQKQVAMNLLNLKNQELEKVLARNKKLFMVVTHDLSNPIMVLTSNIKLLQKKYDDESFRERFFTKTSQAEKTIHSIIENSKTMMAIEDGKLEVNLDKVPIKDVVIASIDTFQTRLDEKKIHIELDNCFENIYVYAQEVSLRVSVINNIISNALKFSSADSYIHISCNQIDDRIHLSIKDNGIGIPKKLLDVLFDQNHKTTRVGLAGEKGTGYGLPLAKTYMKAFGGDLLCRSIENEGTEFVVILRAYKSEASV